MSGPIRVGDKVRLTIVGTAHEVKAHPQSGRQKQTVNVMYGDRDATGHIDVLSHGVTIEVLAPDSWPPRGGDLWEDSHSVKWFCLCPTGTAEYRMVSEHGRYDSDGVEALLQQQGPFRLIHRPSDNEPPF